MAVVPSGLTTRNAKRPVSKEKLVSGGAETDYDERSIEQKSASSVQAVQSSGSSPGSAQDVYLGNDKGKIRMVRLQTERSGW
jgi:hypothetical protein